jgi:hypothetical protein
LAGYLCACNNGKTPETPISALLQDTASFTTAHWSDSIQSFGTIREGDTVRLRFHFTNTGSKPLSLLDVRPVCGCTATDYTRSPVMPGNDGFIDVAFDSHHYPGAVRKTVFVTVNTHNKSRHTLIFAGTVQPQAE